MKQFLFLLLVLYTAGSQAQSFGAGNIVVLRIGKGDGPMTAGVAQRVYLDEYSPCGEKVRSIQMPDTVIGSNRRLTLPVSTADYSEGYMSLSQDGQYLAFGGYDAAPGTASVSTTASSTVNRVVAVVDASGTVNTSTAFSNRFNAVVIRSASVDGTKVWATGGGSGIVYAALGSTGTSSTLLNSNTGRSLAVFDGQLYATSTATGYRLAKVGTGLPTAGSQTLTNLPGYTTSEGSPYQFLMVHLNGSGTTPDVLYVADNNQLKKYSLVSGSWVANGTVGTSSSDKYRGITGYVSGTDVVLYAVRRNDNAIGNGGEIVKLTDNTGYNASFSNIPAEIVAQADDNEVFRSIVMAPQGVPLPRAALSIKGTLQQREVLLQWQPALVNEGDYFMVQQSADARNYTVIGEVAAIPGNASFRYTDKQPASGVSYYRVIQVSKEGRKQTYPTVRITADVAPMVFKVSSAGLQGQPLAELYTYKPVQGSLVVYDMNGRQVLSHKLSTDKGMCRTLLPMPAGGSGMYMAVFVNHAGEVFTSKFVY
jgi:hypothetical protein